MDQQELLPQTATTEMLGRYRILRRLGRGGMGEVWLCEDQRLIRQVAVKTLPVQNQQDRTCIQRFEREAKAAAALNHPHILPVHDYGKQPLADDRIITYIVMPYIQGGSLSERIDFYTRQNRYMPREEALTFLSQAANAIDYAHKRRLIHRDIKPDNMLLRDENWLLLADFGIARMLTASEQLTTAGNGVGTPEFMAPEQAQGRADITSDNYSLAVVAYLLFTGRLPFQAESAIATTIQHLIEQPPPPRQFNPYLSPAIEHLLLQGLAKDPAERPALASDFVTQLERASHDEAYQPAVLPTIKDLPALAFQESIPVLQLEQAEDEQRSHPLRLLRRLSRRQMLTVSGIAATALAGGALGAWGITHTPSSAHAFLQLPAHPTVSARPRSTGKDRPVLVLTGHSEHVSSMTWSQDSRYLISVGLDNQVLRWDIPALLQKPDRAPLTPLYTDQFRCSPSTTSLFASYSPDANTLAICNSQISNTATQITLCTPALKSVSQISFNASIQGNNPSMNGMAWVGDHYLALARTESAQKATHYDTYKLYLVDTARSQHWTVDTAPNDFDPTNFNSWLSSYHNGLLAVVHSYSIVVGNIKLSGQPTWQPLTTIHPSSQDNILMMDWSADGKYLVVQLSSADSLLYIRWQESQPLLNRLLMPTSSSSQITDCIACNPVSLSPGIAAGVGKGTVYLWDFKENSSFVRRLDSGGINGHIKSLAWSPDGRWLAAGLDDSNTSIIIWKLS